MKPLMFRQGDVLLRQIDQMPKDLKQVRPIIAVGEGHHEHKVMGDAIVFADKLSGKLFVEVKTVGELAHVHTNTDLMADHFPIQLPAGFYEVVYQQEYSPFTKTVNGFLD